MKKPSPGRITFISGPSGVGKGTLIDWLRNRHDDWVFPPSCTTRDPRAGEIPGQTYHFITKDEFQQRLDNNEFLEHACVHGQHWYGTLEAPLLEGVAAGKTVIREFDVQGFMQAKKVLDRSLYQSVFLLPDGGADLLIKRIRERSPLAPAEINHRMESLQHELGLSSEYDFQLVVLDGQIEQSGKALESLILSSDQDD